MVAAMTAAPTNSQRLVVSARAVIAVPSRLSVKNSPGMSAKKSAQFTRSLPAFAIRTVKQIAATRYSGEVALAGPSDNSGRLGRAWIVPVRQRRRRPEPGAKVGESGSNWPTPSATVALTSVNGMAPPSVTALAAHFSENATAPPLDGIGSWHVEQVEMAVRMKRFLIGVCMAAASLTVASAALVTTGTAGAATGSCVQSETMQLPPTCVVPPGVANTVSVPTVAPTLPFTGTPGAAAPAASTPTPTVAATGGLPFTGADVEEIAVVGLGAVLAGGLLMLRRRRSNA